MSEEALRAEGTTTDERRWTRIPTPHRLGATDLCSSVSIRGCPFFWPLDATGINKPKDSADSRVTFSAERRGFFGQPDGADDGATDGMRGRASERGSWGEPIQWIS